MTHWTSYWRSGQALSSFAEGEAAFGYPDDVLQVWQQIWTELPEQAEVLDVGTGNGALAVAMAQYSANTAKSWQITGIDLADIKPASDIPQVAALQALLQQIAFFGNCGIEKTPFKDEQFDGIYSQFGLEYANWNASLQELHRICKPGGQVIALLHSCESELSQDCALGISILSHCLQQSPLVTLAEQLLTRSEFLLHHKQSIATDEPFQQLNQALLTEVKALQQRYSTGNAAIWFQDVLSRLAPLVHQLQPGNLQRFQHSFAQLEQHRLRLLDQQKATIDQTKSNEIMALARHYGWKVTMRSVELDAGPFAMRLELSKSL
ncbi:MAG: class I SAM-dependent methyltransferase [Alkalimonas sp.]|nr:class I SAM-dependent methyltransferase [Alkalimonas sp.]